MAATRAVGDAKSGLEIWLYQSGKLPIARLNMDHEDGHFLLNMEMCSLLCYFSGRKHYLYLEFVDDWKGPFFWKGETSPK